MHFRPHPECSPTNSYPWSPFPPEAGPSRTRSSHAPRLTQTQARLVFTVTAV